MIGHLSEYQDIKQWSNKYASQECFLLILLIGSSKEERVSASVLCTLIPSIKMSCNV